MEQCKKTGEVYTNIRKFAEEVSIRLSRRMGEKCEIKLQEVRKNNGVLLQGLIILKEQSNLSPTVYLNPFWEQYISGTSMERILNRIMETYEANMPAQSVDMNFFREYEKVKPRICYRLVNTLKNKALLEQVPHVELLDLSLCFFYAYEDETLGSGAILIYNHHMEMWGCTTAMLMREAAENTGRLYPGRIYQMKELLADYVPEPLDVPMKVLTNRAKCNGATCMVYPGMLRGISEQFKENLYILPSSVHEVIILPESEVTDTDQVREMINQVNVSCVDREEVLSDSLYFYNYSLNRLEIAGSPSV